MMSKKIIDLGKTDLILSLTIGFLSSLMLIAIGRNLSAENVFLVLITSYFNYLIIVAPVVCVAVLFLFRLLSVFIGRFVYQFGKFFLVGGFNFLLDATILNVLIFTTGVAVGLEQSSFKGASFAFGIISSYLLNKYWTFSAGSHSHKKKEIGRFFLVSSLGFIFNVTIDYVLVNSVDSFWGMRPMLWAQFSATLASLITMLWNFSGYKFIVFKQHKIKHSDVQTGVISQVSPAEL